MQKAVEYTLFSSTYGTFSRIHHKLGYKTSHSKFKKNKIVSSKFPNHKAMRLEVNNKEKKLQKTQTHGGYTIRY